MTTGNSTSETVRDGASTEPARDDPDANPEIPWERLSGRMVWVNLVRLVISIVPGLLATAVLNTPAGPVWPLLIVSGFGVGATVLAFVRWATTRYRVTEERVERRTGWLVRQYRYVPRDRIRSVDSSVRIRHRLAGVRVVHIGSGESKTSFKLDALAVDTAERLRQSLMPDLPTRQARSTEAAAGQNAAVEDADGRSTADQHRAEADTPEHEEVLARFRKPWILYEIFSIWAIFVAAGPAFGLYWTLRPFNVDLLRIIGDLVDWETRGLWWSIVLCCVVAYPLGVIGLAIVFIMTNWNFELVRTTTNGRPGLLTRQGLLTTRLIYRDELRVRGVNLKEPLLWRWIGLTKTSVITTGLNRSSDETPASGILPRVRKWEALEVAARVLHEEPSPLEVPLRRHPRGALTRRLLWATIGPAIAAGVLFWLGATDVVAPELWLIAAGAWPLTLALAVIAYRALGHTLTAKYLVMRRGAFNRSTVALQHPAVIGWTLRQSILQRLGRRMTVQVPTAAGERHYVLPDAGTAQALAFVRGATPELATEFIRTADPRNMNTDGN